MQSWNTLDFTGVIDLDKYAKRARIIARNKTKKEIKAEKKAAKEEKKETPKSKTE